MSAEGPKEPVKPFELCDFRWDREPKSGRIACALAIARFLESQGKIGWRVAKDHSFGLKSFTYTQSGPDVVILSSKPETFEQGTPETLIPHMDMLCRELDILPDKSQISVEILQDELNNIRSCQSQLIWTFAPLEPAPIPPSPETDKTTTKSRQRKDFKTAIDFHGLTYNTSYMLTRAILTCLPDSQQSNVTLIVGQGKNRGNTRLAVQEACQKCLCQEIRDYNSSVSQPKEGKIFFTQRRKNSDSEHISVPVSSEDVGCGYFQKPVGPTLLSTFPNP